MTQLKPNKIPLKVRDIITGKQWLVLLDGTYFDPTWLPLVAESPGNTILSSRWNSMETAVQSVSDGHTHDNTNSQLLPNALPTTIAYADAATAGTSGVYAFAAHRHGFPAGNTTPVTQAFSDAAAIGTSADIARANHRHGMPASSASVWDRQGETILSSAATTITVSGMTAKLNLLIYVQITGFSGTSGSVLRFNNDGGSNYASRRNLNGGADSTATSQSSVDIGDTSVADRTYYIFVGDISGARKNLTWFGGDQPAVSAAPGRFEGVGTWGNTTSQITRVDIISGNGTDTFGTNSRVSVFGGD